MNDMNDIKAKGARAGSCASPAWNRFALDRHKLFNDILVTQSPSKPLSLRCFAYPFRRDVSLAFVSVLPLFALTWRMITCEKQFDILCEYWITVEKRNYSEMWLCLAIHTSEWSVHSLESAHILAIFSKSIKWHGNKALFFKTLWTQI